jgi:hypothetical protein
MRQKERTASLKAIRMVLVFLIALLQISIATASPPGQGESRVLTHPEVKSLPSKEKRWALIVGVDEYEKDVSSLKGGVNDAKALKDVLVKQAGFPESQVILLTTEAAATRDQLPTRVNILEELDNLSGRVPADGLLLFSFSGHGVSIGNEAYLIPSDGRITKNLKLLRDFSIDVRRIKEAIEESKVKQVLVLLDACRNELGRGEAINPLTEAYKSGFSFDVVNSEVKAFATLYATSIGYRAFEFFDKDTKQYRGYFSYAVVEGLKGKAANAQGEITLGGLTDYVDRTVPERVRLAKGEKQEPFKEIAGYKESELVLAVAIAGSDSTNLGLSNRDNIRKPAKIDAVAVEQEYWEAIRNSSDAQDYRDFLQNYPNGAYSSIARTKLKQLDRTKPSQSIYDQATNTQPVSGSVLVVTGFPVRHWTLSHFHAGTLSVSSSGVRWDEAGPGVDVGDNFSVPCSQVKSVKRGNFFNNAWSNDFYLSIPKRRYRFDTKDGTEAKAIIKVIEDHCGKH